MYATQPLNCTNKQNETKNNSRILKNNSLETQIRIASDFLSQLLNLADNWVTLFDD